MRERLEQVDNLNSAALFLNFIRNKCKLKLNTEEIQGIKNEQIGLIEHSTSSINISRAPEFPFFPFNGKEMIVSFQFQSFL